MFRRLNSVWGTAYLLISQRKKWVKLTHKRKKVRRRSKPLGKKISCRFSIEFTRKIRIWIEHYRRMSKTKLGRCHRCRMKPYLRGSLSVLAAASDTRNSSRRKRADTTRQRSCKPNRFSDQALLNWVSRYDSAPSSQNEWANPSTKISKVALQSTTTTNYHSNRSSTPRQAIKTQCSRCRLAARQRTGIIPQLKMRSLHQSHTNYTVQRTLQRSLILHLRANAALRSSCTKTIRIATLISC